MHERKVRIKKKGRVYEFSDKRNLDIMDFWGVKGEMIFRSYLRNLLFYYDILRNEKDDISVVKKNDKMIFSLAWNVMFIHILKNSCFEFFEDGKYGLSLSQKVDMIFTDY